MVINFTPSQEARLLFAFGRKMGLGRDATGPEVKAAFIDFGRSTIKDQERLAVVEANPSAEWDPT